MIQRASLLFLFCALLLCSCGKKLLLKGGLNPNEPLRIAVLPFMQVDSKGRPIDDGGNLLIDDVSVVSTELGEQPALYVQKLVQTELSKTSLDLLPPYLVSAKLMHQGLRTDSFQIDAPQIAAIPPQEICTEILNCDAVLYGKVTRWDRSYYGIQSVASVGIDLTVVSARDGSVLYQATAEDSESRGITKIPTGFSDLVIEPIKGLDYEILADLARKLVSQALEPLTGGAATPKGRKVAPPAINAAAHDGGSGGARISSSRPLTVVLYGSPKRRAFFSIGSKVENAPLHETDPGHYIGMFYPLAGERFEDQQVTVSIVDDAGRETKQQVGNGPVSVGS